MVVTRMLRNVKAIYLNANDIPSALPVQRRLAALNPLDPVEVQDLGVLCLNADRPGEALDPLQTYLDELGRSAAEAEEIQALLRGRPTPRGPVELSRPQSCLASVWSPARDRGALQWARGSGTARLGP